MSAADHTFAGAIDSLEREAERLCEDLRQRLPVEHHHLVDALEAGYATQAREARENLAAARDRHLPGALREWGMDEAAARLEAADRQVAR